MKLLRDLSIRRKQSLLVVGTSMVSLLLACTAFVTYDVTKFRAEMVESLSSLAGVVGNNLTAAIDFGDEATARETLSALRDETNIDEARVYDVAGDLFADYARPGETGIHHPPEFRDTGHVYFDDHLYLFHPVTVQGETVGTVMLVSNLEELTDRLTSYGIIVVGVFVFAMAIAYMLTVRLGRLITGPIHDLASLMHSVAAQQDYSRRAPRTSGNEIGKLVDGFNEMLTQIQLRDGELRAAREELENRVRERTQELQQAVAESAREKQRFQLIFESVPVGISLRQAAPGGGSSTFILNEAHRHITGLNAEESVVPANYAAMTHPDDLARQRALAQQLDEGGIDHFSLEKRYCRRDGTTVWVSFSVQRSRRPDGSFDDLSTVVDITDLKRAQEEALREQARFELIFDSVPVGISLRHIHGNGSNAAFLINQAHLDICGVTREQASDQEVFRRLTHPDDFDHQDRTLKSLGCDDRTHVQLEKRYIRPDGKVAWVTLSVKRRCLPDGGIEDLSTIVDITELKKAQEDAAREQARFKFIFESVPVGISWFVPGVEDTHLVNPEHERITGVSAEASRVPGAFARVTHPEDYQRQQELTKKFVSGEIDHFSVEKRYLQPDGRTVWAVMTSRMYVDPATGVQQSVTTLVDITELKQALDENARERARFKFIFDSVPVGFTWMVRGQLDSRIANPAQATITGVPLEKCQEIELYRKATHPEDQARQQALHRRLEAGEIASYHLEKRYIHPDGSIRWVELTVRHFLDQHTGETQEITTAVDITDRKRAEEQLEATHKQLLQASRQAGMAEVATGVLHNVGNVLNSINVSATIVAESVRKLEVNNLARVGTLLRQHDGNLGTFFSTDPKAAQIPKFIEALAEHMATGQSTVIHELEDLRKNVEHIKDIVAMQQSYAKVCGVAEEIPVTELVEDALRMNAGALSRHEVDLIRDFQTEQAIEVEKHKVLQILVNLIRNAKYACDDSGRDDKRLIVRIEDEGENVRISVIDNGVGIPAGNLTRIFSHGFTTRKNGHGFGLHSGALAAKEMGGSLTVASDGPGCGAAFSLALPVRKIGERAA